MNFTSRLLFDFNYLRAGLKMYHMFKNMPLKIWFGEGGLQENFS